MTHKQYHFIGTVEQGSSELYAAPRQATLRPHSHGSIIRIQPQYKQCLRDLEGFERIWVIFDFHRSEGHWRPCVQPPRGEKKVGVFASRSPHRPNSIGISCVPLIKISDSLLHIGENDLINGTPVLDIKPYLPYADAFPNAFAGWTESEKNSQPWEISLENSALQQLAWLDCNSRWPLRNLIFETLSHSPLPRKGHRVTKQENDHYELRCKSWRVHYTLDSRKFKVTILNFSSAYSSDFLESNNESRWDDAQEHRLFQKKFP